MAQLIDKSAVVAEIEKELNTTKKYSTEYVNGKKYALKKILSFLDTLEVKEVDLDFTAIAMPSDSSIWVNHDDLPYLEDGDNVEILIIKK